MSFAFRKALRDAGKIQQQRYRFCAKKLSNYCLTLLGITKQPSSLGFLSHFTDMTNAIPLILALALEDHDADTGLHNIGVVSTGERFDSIIYPENISLQKLNPFMNAGAIATLDLVAGRTLEERYARFCHTPACTPSFNNGYAQRQCENLTCGHADLRYV